MSQPGKTTAPRRILLIEDDLDLCSLMQDYLAQHRFQTEASHDGARGLARALEGGFDLVLLDVMLPVLDGFEVLRQFRKRAATPVIMLTARTASADRVTGLDIGADDYLPKPFDPEELLARIRAVLRRSGAESLSSEVEAGGVTLNLKTRVACYYGEALDLTSLEFDLLELLVNAAGRAISRDEITGALYQRKASPYDRSLDVHISHLRKKLERGDRTPIQTVRGVGYQFAASEVER